MIPNFHTRATNLRMHFHPWLVLLSLAVLTGCREEEGISQYTVPQQAATSEPEYAWHIKLTGPPDAVENVTAQFQEFLASIEVGQSSDGTPTWQLPEGWAETPPASSITFKQFTTSDPEVACSVTVLPVNGGTVNDLHSNYNRWLGQVGRPEVPGVLWQIDADAAGQHQTIEGAAGDIELFDLRTDEDADEPKRIVAAVVFQETGPVPVSELPATTGTLPDGHPPIGGGSATAGPGEMGDIPLTFDVPANWVAGAANTGFGQLRLWNIDVDGMPVKVAISHTGGNLTQNIARWGTQAGVSVTSEEDVANATEASMVDGIRSLNVMFEGPEKAVGGTIVPSGSTEGFFWFLKIDGPTAAVAKILPEFEAFVASVKFVE